MHSMGPAVIAVKCLQNRWLIHRPHERHYQPKVATHTAKRERGTTNIGSLRCAMLPANTKARSLYPNCFWGRVLGVVPKSYNTID